MTGKYWTGIFVAMLAIFGVGMLIARGVGRAKTFVEDNIPSPMRLMMSTGFKVDGDRIGDIERLQFMRANPSEFDSAVVTVRIDDSADVRRIGTCTLRATNAHPFGSSTRFVCTSHADSAKLALVPFGHIEVLPSGEHVTFYVASSVEQDMRLHAYRGKGSADSGTVDINMTEGNFSITVNGQDVIRANGDSGLVIRDSNGRPIVQINGDSNGGSVRVTDGNGKQVVNIHGTDGRKSRP